jgi:hypothetical protein
VRARPSAEQVSRSVEQPAEQVSRSVEQPAEQVPRSAELSSDVSDPVEDGSVELRSAIRPKRSATSITRYPGELSSTELSSTGQGGTGLNRAEQVRDSC